jgi:hypothetical protein
VQVQALPVPNKRSPFIPILQNMRFDISSSTTTVIALAKVVVAFSLLLGLSILTSFPIMWIWNWVMPDVFGLKEITWLQALELSALARLIWGTGNPTSSN